MNKIILLGVRDLKTDEEIKPDIDYGIFLVASRCEVAIPDTHSDEDPDEKKFKLKISHIDSIIDIKTSKNIKYEKGKSPSQIMRWRITEKLGNEEYENFMKYLIGRIDGLTDDYIDILKKQ